MRIAKGMDTCRLEDKVKFIFVIKEVMDYRTKKGWIHPSLLQRGKTDFRYKGYG